MAFPLARMLLLRLKEKGPFPIFASLSLPVRCVYLSGSGIFLFPLLLSCSASSSSLAACFFHVLSLNSQTPNDVVEVGERQDSRRFSKTTTGDGKWCVRLPTRRCARCGAVAYCAVAHQIAHWPEHKEECGRLEQHMKHMDTLNEFPFTFTQEATVQPLTIYYATQVAGLGSWTSGISEKLYIHYLGPEKELLQLSLFSELRALFPNRNVHLELIGPLIPQHRDGEMITLSDYAHCIDRDCICKSSSKTVSGDVHTSEPSAVTLQLRSGFYHDRYMDITKDSSPHLVIAPNAGIAAYSSWLPTIELIKDMNIPAVFSDYCKEACHLGARCISSITGRPLNIPIQLNPFRQPMVVEDSVLVLPCYSNCFLYGMSNWGV